MQRLGSGTGFGGGDANGADSDAVHSGRLGGGDQRSGELLVEDPEVFDAVPVAGERLGAAGVCFSAT